MKKNYRYKINFVLRIGYVIFAEKFYDSRAIYETKIIIHPPVGPIAYGGLVWRRRFYDAGGSVAPA